MRRSVYECGSWRKSAVASGMARPHVLLRREGLVANHTRAERAHREEKLSLRLKNASGAPAIRVWRGLAQSALTSGGLWIS